jgi:hypothetical protein
MSKGLRKILVFVVFAATSVLAGCQAPEQKEAGPAAAVMTDKWILKNLEERQSRAVPLKANGQCEMLFYVNGKPHRENFPVQLWVNPPSEIYMQGDVAFNAKGVVLGSNTEEFWFALQPKEISSYWWGRWSQQNSLGTMMINPHIVLEGIGVIKIDSEEQWTFGQEDSYRVLTRQDEGRTKRIYVNSRDGRIRRMEYVGAEGESVTVAELDKYIEVTEDFYVPTRIKIIRKLTGDKVGFVSITLKISNVKATSFTEEQERFLFERRPMQGFKHIYRIIDSRVVEQQQ